MRARVSPLTERRTNAEAIKDFLRKKGVKDKLAQVLKERPRIMFSEKEKESIRFLFDCRNEIMHSTPKYKEYPAVPPHTDGMTQGQIDQLEGFVSVLEGGSSSSDLLKHAQECQAVAEMTIKRLFNRQQAKPLEPTGVPPAAQR